MMKYALFLLVVIMPGWSPLLGNDSTKVVFYRSVDYMACKFVGLSLKDYTRPELFDRFERLTSCSLLDEDFADVSVIRSFLEENGLDNTIKLINDIDLIKEQYSTELSLREMEQILVEDLYNRPMVMEFERKHPIGFSSMRNVMTQSIKAYLLKKLSAPAAGQNVPSTSYSGLLYAAVVMAIVALAIWKRGVISAWLSGRFLKGSRKSIGKRVRRTKNRQAGKDIEGELEKARKTIADLRTQISELNRRINVLEDEKNLLESRLDWQKTGKRAPQDKMVKKENKTELPFARTPAPAPDAPDTGDATTPEAEHLPLQAEIIPAPDTPPPAPDHDIFYLSLPNQDGSFDDQPKPAQHPGSLYEFTADRTRKTAIFRYVGGKHTLKDALDRPERYLFPVCDQFNAFDQNAKKIVTKEAGRAQLESDRWTVISKAKISFE